MWAILLGMKQKARQAMRAAALGITMVTTLPAVDDVFDTNTSSASAQQVIPHTQNNLVFVEGVRQTLLDDTFPWIRLSSTIYSNANSPSLQGYAHRIDVDSRLLNKSITLWNGLDSPGFRQLGLDRKVFAMDCLLSHIVLAAEFNYIHIPNKSNYDILDEVQKLHVTFSRGLQIHPKGCMGVYRSLGL